MLIFSQIVYVRPIHVGSPTIKSGVTRRYETAVAADAAEEADEVVLMSLLSAIT